LNPTTFSDSTGEDASQITMGASPELAARHVSLWLDMPSPATERSGYQFRWSLNTEKGNRYAVTLSKWVAGTQTVLASSPEALIPVGTTLKLSDSGATVKAWTSTEAPLLTAADSTFGSGYAGIEAAGSISRSYGFRAGSTAPPPTPAKPTLTSVSPSSPSSFNVIYLGGSADAASTVRVYSNSSCTGTPLATGTAGALGASNLTVEVPANATTTLYATAGNLSGTSPCSTTSITFTADSIAPAAPTLSSAAPAGPATDNAPEILGSAETGSTVSLYANATCTGTAATGTAAAFASPGLTVSVADDTTTVFHGTATDAAGNVSPCSSSAVTYKESTSSLYWGGWVKSAAGESPYNMAVQSTFESTVGKTASLVHFSSPWFSSGDCGGTCKFKTTEFSSVRSHGSIPFFSWAPNGVSSTDLQISEGAQDTYIKKWAEEAKSWGHPFFLRFAWEMNGSWFRWGVGNAETKSTVSDYVAMWEHVHKVFNEVGATNVTWVWCPNIDPTGSLASMSGLYPPGGTVDWTCLDGYNGNDPRRSFKELFSSSYSAITGTIAPSKPMVVGEVASTEAGGSKSEWIEGMFKSLGTEFPKIRGLMWFDKINEVGPGGYTDWPVESSPAATSAFATGIQTAPFAAANYGSLNASPIPLP
jgi:hypothetical protein